MYLPKKLLTLLLKQLPRLLEWQFFCKSKTFAKFLTVKNELHWIRRHHPKYRATACLILPNWALEFWLFRYSNENKNLATLDQIPSLLESPKSVLLTAKVVDGYLSWAWLSHVLWYLSLLTVCVTKAVDNNIVIKLYQVMKQRWPKGD